MSRIEGVEDPAVHLNVGVSRAENQGQRKKCEDGPVYAETAHHQTQRIFRPAGPERWKITQCEKDCSHLWVIAAEVKNEHQLDTSGRVIEVPPANGEKRQGKQPPFSLFQPGHRQEA